MGSKVKTRGISRDKALSARPQQVPVVRREETDGELKVTVRLQRPRWQRALGADKEGEHAMILDALGREVYEACDGKQTVRRIVKRFAAVHKVSVPEAEQSVTQYMLTLMKKGLIAMAVDKGRRSE